MSGLPGLERIRFTSPHPAFFNSRLIEAIGALPKVCDSIHLPLQSGSDKILKAMNRPYGAAQYLSVAERLKALLPDLAFSTDVIVGFPGETEADFEATRQLMERVSFDNAFIFKYSPRSGTKAAEMPDSVPQEVKESRNHLLLEDLAKRVALRNKALEGRVLKVMAEGPSKRNAAKWAGRSTSNKVVIFDAPAGLKAGDVLSLRIVRSTSMSLFGELIP
jgi:tRNA-2-methylthio-N6-dimethylallyladenosine synthase